MKEKEWNIHYGKWSKKSLHAKRTKRKYCQKYWFEYYTKKNMTTPYLALMERGFLQKVN